MRSFPFTLSRCAFLLATLALCSFSIATASPDSTTYDQVLMYVGHLNFDCTPDTVIGDLDAEHHQYIPTHIAWGVWDTLGTHPCQPYYPGLPPDSLPRLPRFPATQLDYPEWRELGISLAVNTYNPDTLADLVFHIWGEVGDTLAPRDTVRALTLFGQNRLDTHNTIDIAIINPIQSTPFFAMDMTIGDQLVEPAERDLSGDTSYIVLPWFITVDGGGSPGPQTVHIVEEGPWTTRVYPNPASNAARVEVKPLPEGEYNVEVIAVNGLVQHRQEVAVDRSGELLRTLDLSSLASGYYILRVYSARRLYGTYPVVITR